MIRITIVQVALFFSVNSALGESVFEKIIKDINGSKNNSRVIYPITSLVEKLDEHIYHNENKVLGVISKSFNHQNKNIFSNKAPFTIYSTFLEGKIDYQVKDRVFLIYHDHNNHLEVISYNEEEGRFNFLQVHNYSNSGENKLKKAKLNACMQCHKDLVPLHEKNNIIDSNNLPSIVSEIKNDDKNPRRLEKIGEDFIFNGVMLSQQKMNNELMINSIENSQKIIQFNQTWKKICAYSSDIAEVKHCRANILYHAFILSLSPLEVAKTLSSRSYNIFLNKIDNEFRKKNFKVINLEEELVDLIQYLASYFPQSYHNYILKYLGEPPENLESITHRIFSKLQTSKSLEKSLSLREEFPVRGLILNDLQANLELLSKK